MCKYQVLEMNSKGKKIVHHSLERSNADKLVRAYKRERPHSSYIFEPMSKVDKNDVDFSNDIIKDMLKENISDESFLYTFKNRKEALEEALIDMTNEARSEKAYSSVEELFNDIDNS